MFQFENNEFQNDDNEFENIKNVVFEFVNDKNNNEIVNNELNNVEFKIINAFENRRFIFKRSKMIVDFNDDFNENVFRFLFFEFLTRRFEHVNNRCSKI